MLYNPLNSYTDVLEEILTDKFSNYGKAEEPVKEPTDESIEPQPSESKDPFSGYSSTTDQINKPIKKAEAKDEKRISIESIPISERDNQQINLSELIHELDNLVVH